MDKLVRPLGVCAVACGLLFAADAAAIFLVTEPWVRVAANGRSAEAYMELRSTEGARLVAVRTADATDVVLLAPGSRRAPVGEIPLAPNATVKLAPGAFRIALAHLDHPLKLGDRVALVLTIEGSDGGRQEIPADAEVRRRSPTDDHLRAHKH